MVKNGKFFLSIIDQEDFTSSVWDPYSYKSNTQKHRLGDFVDIQKPSSKNIKDAIIPFDAIEYRSIPPKSYLTFTLTPRDNIISLKHSIVNERELLFGTMRAYLGNALVTPLAQWVNQKPPISFYVKSEFAIIYPNDQLHYFWLIYLKSKTFLENLPLGSGGTRPRLQIKTLLQMPIMIPDFERRKEINETLKSIAQQEWQNYLQVTLALNSIQHQF